MKPRWLMLICLMMLSITLLACSLASSATPAPAGGEQPIEATATPAATLPPIAPGTRIDLHAQAADRHSRHSGQRYANSYRDAGRTDCDQEARVHRAVGLRDQHCRLPARSRP